MLERAPQEEVGQEWWVTSLLHRSDLQFRRLLEKLPAGAYTCDPGGLITYFNHHAVQLWGRVPKLHDPVDRFCGSFKLLAMDGSPIAHNQCWMALALKMDQAYNGHEIVIERPDGTRITVLAHANPIHDEFGQLLGAVNVLVDISDRQRAEEALQQAHAELEKRVEARTAELATALGALRREVAERERAEAERRWLEEVARRAEHLALLGRLAAGVSHEIRNPLGVIYLHADILEEELQQLPLEHQAQLTPALREIKTYLEPIPIGQTACM